jgi:nucleoside phosphorylase
LSGGSRVFSQPYLRDLLIAVVGGPGTGGYIGGEMEGVGLLSACEKANPVWVVVKGISDFADDDRHREIAVVRAQACRNAAHFVLCALRRSGNSE